MTGHINKASKKVVKSVGPNPKPILVVMIATFPCWHKRNVFLTNSIR